jgi:hypothetical protein
MSSATTSNNSRTRTPAKRAGWTRRLFTDIMFVARRDRKLLLLPLIGVILLLAALIVFGTALGPLAPFIYPLF